jgi:type II secretory pathway pseudopilin PulG
MRPVNDRGYAMAALLVGMSVMAIMLSVALPVWRTAVQREREAELVFRGEQYAHAIELFSRRNGGYPPNLDVLEQGRYIRKLYTDPMTGEGEFQPVYLGQPLPGQAPAPAQPGRAGAGGGPLGAPLGTPLQGANAGQPRPIGAGPIVGVVSSSTAESLRLYNGRGRYSEWAFVAIVATADPGSPGGAQNPGLGPGARGAGPGVPGRGGRGDGGQGRGAGPPGRGFPGPVNPAGQGGFQFPGGQQQGP